MSLPTPGTTISEDGRWWWDGSEWQPNDNPPSNYDGLGSEAASVAAATPLTAEVRHSKREAGLSRKGNEITVTWVRTLPHHDPRAFLPEPTIPEPRTFPHEPYFAATLIATVAAGQEFPSIVEDVASAPVGEPQPVKTFASAGGGNGDATLVADPPTPLATGITQAMRELNEMKDAGLITEDEYSAKRTELLARI